MSQWNAYYKYIQLEHQSGVNNVVNIMKTEALNKATTQNHSDLLVVLISSADAKVSTDGEGWC
jgi:hypothetical protein